MKCLWVNVAINHLVEVVPATVLFRQWCATHEFLMNSTSQIIHLVTAHWHLTDQLIRRFSKCRAPNVSSDYIANFTSWVWTDRGFVTDAKADALPIRPQKRWPRGLCSERFLGQFGQIPQNHTDCQPFDVGFLIRLTWFVSSNDQLSVGYSVGYYTLIE